MADNEKSTEDRTEAATSFRREEFRNQGTVAMSRELLSVAVMMAVGLSLYSMASIFLREFQAMAHKFFGFTKPDFTRDSFLDLRVDMFHHWGWMALPVMGVTVAAGFFACVAQVGFHITTEPLSPNWDRLNPINGFKKIFSWQGTVEGLKAGIKLVVVGLIVYNFVKGQAPGIGNYLSMTLPEGVNLTLNTVGKFFFTILFALLFMAALDYGFQRFQLEKQMRMTKREAKEEFKLREGDPLIKSRIRSIQRRMASRRMMDAVPKADVIVTNPTHLAVALKYDADTMAAPKVVAKGAGVIAQKMKEIARFHRIPVVENKPLARAIYKEIEINQYVPRELYKAVAEVLAYVYRLKGVANGKRI